MMNELHLPQPYLLFLGDVTVAGYAKTAFGLRDWARERCVGEYCLPGAMISTGLPRLSPEEAYLRGARAVVIGVAPVGGAIAECWIPVLIEAMEAGLDVIGGMHAKLADHVVLSEAARRTSRKLFDVRVPPRDIPIATGRKRTGMRLLTVGTDCALGKKYTALALTRAFRDRGLAADFRATGQTGIMIAGHGIPIDAVIADFIAGAAEILSPDAQDDHWDIIEGQGSLFHPAYAGVSLGLLHGSQPDVLVLCHEAGRNSVLGFPNYPIPPLEQAIELHLTLARRVNPTVRCAAVSLNTSALSCADADEAIRTVTRELDMPCVDPLRQPDRLASVVDACVTAPTSRDSYAVR